jgi:hypothetical protein
MYIAFIKPKQQEIVSMSKSSRNQGEGDREAARRFNEKSEAFIDSEEGKRAIDEGTDLSEGEQQEAERKEREALKRAREKDPQVSRDYSRGEK